MQRRALLQASILLLAFAVAIIFAATRAADAQTTSPNAALSATIESEITADPRSQTMSPQQIDSMVDALTAQAQAQGVTADQISYKPALVAGQTAPVLASCTGFACALGYAFGLDGSVPLIPLALFVFGALFILIFGIMHEMGHPHAKHWGEKGAAR